MRLFVRVHFVEYQFLVFQILSMSANETEAKISVSSANIDDTLRSFESMKISPKQCRDEQSCSKEMDAEVDELAEYFGYFVNIKTKMSALVESLYT